MDEKKLVITTKKFKADKTTIVSARIPLELVERIENIAAKTNRNRNEIIQMLLSYAVDNAIIENDIKEEK